MKAARNNRRGENREMLLKEFFLNASLLARFKALGEEGVRFAGQLMAKPQSVPVPVRVHHRRSLGALTFSRPGFRKVSQGLRAG